MDAETSRLLGDLIRRSSVAGLATLHDGLPFASMVPYAPAASVDGGLRLVTHVSRLSAHTRDMLESSDVCLLIMGSNPPDMPPQALPRVSIPATASFIDPGHSEHAGFVEAYLGRFPFAAEWFGLGDFSIVAFEPKSARLIAGFARALTLSPETLQAAWEGR